MEKNNYPQRKQIRLSEYDYGTEGLYFITICTKNRANILGNIDVKSNNLICNCEIENIDVGADDPVRPQIENKIYADGIKLTSIGQIVETCWKQINDIYDGYIKTDEYIIMPNHIHGIININGRTESSAPTKNNTRI